MEYKEGDFKTLKGKVKYLKVEIKHFEVGIDSKVMIGTSTIASI